MGDPCFCPCGDCRPPPEVIPVACGRCDSYTHERVCSDCGFEPACPDHNCWTTKELEAA